jgi:hypothetical protein
MHKRLSHRAFCGGSRTLDVLASWGDDWPMRTLILLLLAGCAACSTGATPQSQQAPRTPPAPREAQGDTLARIRAMVGTPSCSSDAQCHSLPVGHRACGGPESYLAWSSANTSQQELQALAERYKEERRAADAASGMLSTCRFMPDPGAVCRAGACQLGQAGAPGAM